VLKINPPVIAHRGASAYAPENTMSAFIKAAQLGIKWVEFDVMQAATDELIIFHDEQLERTSNSFGNVCDQPYAYLNSLDVGSWFNAKFSGERIPILLTVIEFLQSVNMFANIEIKPLPGQEERLVKRILKEMQPYLWKANNQFLFSSFSIQTLQILRKYSHTCQIGLLLHEWQAEWSEISQDLNCVSIHINQEIISEESARNIKNMDKLLLCYTVNEPLRAQELYSWGVDAVFSDAPDIILSAIQKCFIL